MVRVSFVIPVKNEARRLKNCLHAISLNRDPRWDIEVVVADNGSTDGTPEVAAAAGATVCSLPGLRVSDLRNQASAVATGEWLAFIDSDHEIVPTWTAGAIEVMKDGRVGAAGALYLAPATGSWVQRAYGRLRGRTKGRGDVRWLGSGNLVVRRSAFEAIGGFDPSLEACEDVDLCKRLRAAGWHLVADEQLESVHLGDPDTLANLFRAERWRGRDNIRVTLRRPMAVEDLPSVLIPLVNLSAMLTVLGSTLISLLVTHHAVWPPLVAGMLIMGGLSSLRTLRGGLEAQLRSPLAWAQLYVVTLVYSLARAMALVLSASHHRQRSSAPPASVEPTAAVRRSRSERRPLRVLAVTSEPPWPLDSGGHIRTFHLLKTLARTADVRLVCPLSPSQTDAVSSLRDVGIHVIAVPVSSRSASGEARRLLGAMLQREPYVMYQRHVWPSVGEAWRDQVRLNPPDVKYLDHLDSLVYLSSLGRDRDTRAPSVIDLHNRYSLLVRRTADEAPGMVKRAFLRREARLLEAMERRAGRFCDVGMTVSDEEARYFRDLGMAAVYTVPNGADCEAFTALPVGRSGKPMILFIGSMSWSPNAAAARFLTSEVFQPLRRRVPDVRLVIVGRNPPADLLALNGQPGLEVTGLVADIQPYLRDASLLAVPLDAGGGTRLKILEAFAAGLPVVSTAVGAEGIHAVPGVHFLEAERPRFVDALEQVLIAPEASARRAEAARALALNTYDWRTIGAQAVSIVEALAEGHRA